ncbi:LAMI_0H13806g1_1 [Lachancea mirantina]|uniref:LAMI_0H13806g1_1 n=1 Tax=Lachancea mirantina TaxID=1230905 RepID=A0A1G4KHW8_9SACH|nr:LAMI_0H13806g1_1 [Lachancea mirantina]
MTAFNDYCIVCQRLVERTGNLYCSSECRSHDTTTGRRKSVVESLVSTPQLCPLDVGADDVAEPETRDEAHFRLDYESMVPTLLSLPRSESYRPRGSELASFDHVAEDNYKLWLNVRLSS